MKEAQDRVKVLAEAEFMGVPIKNPRKWILPKRFKASIPRCFCGSCPLPEGIAALWKQWREDANYKRDWQKWAVVERQQKAIDAAWDKAHWDRRPITTKARKRMFSLNKREERLSRKRNTVLERFAKEYGIPPVDPGLLPDSPELSKCVGAAMKRWRVGIFRRYAWEVTDEDELELARLEQKQEIGLLVCIGLFGDPNQIRDEVMVLVKEAQDKLREKGVVIKKRVRIRAGKGQLDVYAAAWYLHDVRGMTDTEVAYGVFNRALPGANVLKEVRRCVLAGKWLKMGLIERIRGKNTFGFRPEREREEKIRGLEKVLGKDHSFVLRLKRLGTERKKSSPVTN